LLHVSVRFILHSTNPVDVSRMSRKQTWTPSLDEKKFVHILELKAPTQRLYAGYAANARSRIYFTFKMRPRRLRCWEHRFRDV